ncbi:MAG: TIGR03960 family B12-binding radical SAM protein [Acidobacteriota bacterium]
MIKEKLSKILPQVTKPARYTGNELNIVIKDWQQVKAKMLFAFPDVYEVGMSHLGGRILYGLVNEHPDYAMERAFAPWPDMEEKMREAGMPLFSLESFKPAADFDIIGFSLQYELSYSNVLNMLDLTGVPQYSKDRNDTHPLVIAGGPNTFNPEPMADFIDVFVIGDAEEVILQILDITAQHRSAGRTVLLRELAVLTGIYVPSLYEVEYNADGTVNRRIKLADYAPDMVTRAVVSDLDKAYFPEKPLVPYLEIIHDRAVLEVMRGCQRGCRFCQAGIIYRPVRERSVDHLQEKARRIMKATGFDEVSLASLSTADYSGVAELCRSLVDEHGSQGVGVALPSLRVDAFSVSLAQEVQRVRKTTLTFAPEAGSQRMRDVINKNVTEEDVLTSCRAAFASGWLAIKLYFMLGLPTEMDEDLDEMIELVRRIKRAGSEVSRKPPRINVSLAFFVPKPHTPFQWEGQITQDEMQRRKQYILEHGRIKNVNFDFHDSRTSYLEAVLARGDRRLGQMIFAAWQKGAKFDGWREFFRLDLYLEALAECGLDPDFYTTRQRSMDEILPWEFVNTGLNPEFLKEEYEKATKGENTPDCRESGCGSCGICANLEVDIDVKGGVQAAN